MVLVTGSTIQRRRILVQGIVQGVGFRPFVYGLALRFALTGFVYNDSNGVTIEIEGPVESLDSFLIVFYAEKPPLARIDSVMSEQVTPCCDTTFTIRHSQHGSERRALISPDTATCDDCLHELFDPDDRRYGYPFINCTNCGPRFTIVQDVPYDRDKTTMRVFPLCPACQSEYDDPLNRRFHAQPNACPVCGPQVDLLDWSSTASQSVATPDDAIELAAQRLVGGAILAIKGLGGYHLACDALNAEAVQRLRQRKHREARPFALMVPDLETARQLCRVSEAEATLLQACQRPIVLLDLLPDCPVAPGVAPAHTTLGIMLPYTPLHHLLLRAFAATLPPGRPAALVMTSGNLSDEPIAYRDDDAQARLAPTAEGMLLHNRAIHMRCDDSVMRVAAGGEQFFRRSRGYAPEPIALSSELPMPLLACGAHLKNTFCLGKGRQAFVSHHIGDLENLETLTSFREGIEHFQRLFDIYPEAVAYDLHPEYLATKYALDLDIPRKIGVQHHHAHIASVLAEHGISGPVIGVAADGTGYGTDGAVWGGEIMIADLLGFGRVAHLAYVPLPGGEQAIHQPWRMAAAYLKQTYGDAFLELDIPFVQQLERSKWRTLSQMIARGLNCPPTSSLGRLFDAVAALLCIRREVQYEGQAAIELEALASQAGEQDATANVPEWPIPRPPAPHHPRPPARGGLGMGQGNLPKSYAQPSVLDVTPFIRAIVGDIQRGVPVPQIAARFHRSIAELLTLSCLRVREQSGLNVVALSGGVFQNRLLLEQLKARLEEMAFQVFINRRVPPNDGGISLGQLAVAAAQLRQLRANEELS
ncbi:MAG TPA: carbamoyltransferase HypF [Ktedonobacteraceae bacterium]|nr:carbamoyltransferase HypF [Ktedonobacteraceae bacterium]